MHSPIQVRRISMARAVTTMDAMLVTSDLPEIPTNALHILPAVQHHTRELLLHLLLDRVPGISTANEMQLIQQRIESILRVANVARETAQSYAAKVMLALRTSVHRRMGTEPAKAENATPLCEIFRQVSPPQPLGGGGMENSALLSLLKYSLLSKLAGLNVSMEINRQMEAIRAIAAQKPVPSNDNAQKSLHHLQANFEHIVQQMTGL